MPAGRHLSFANVASGLALAIALAGGGVAVAAGLAHNSVGSPQIKPNAVKSSDIKNNAVKGKDVKESTLKTVPSAAEVDTLVTKRVTALPGQTKNLATKSTLVVQLRCVDAGGGTIESHVELRTTANNAMFDANDNGDDDGDLDTADGPIDINTSDGTTQDIEDGGFAALTAAGVSWLGYGFAVNHPGGSNSCLAEMTFTG